jgi:hypothetical protein
MWNFSQSLWQDKPDLVGCWGTFSEELRNEIIEELTPDLVGESRAELGFNGSKHLLAL